MTLLPAAGAPGQDSPVLTGRVGVEVELLAPRGSSRAVLAAELARRCGGTVEPTFHADAEPSLVPGMGRFLHLTRGFCVRDRDGAPVCTLVDDITLRADLDPSARPQPGWYRILSDDARLLRLVSRHADPAADLATVLEPVAALFGARVEEHGAVRRLNDTAGATVALAAPAPGERERPCEVVTPPLAARHLDRLEELLAPARNLGFTVPQEAAVHLHLDGGPYREVSAFRNVVRLFALWREPLRRALATNPACTRLRPLPAALVDLVEQPWRGDWPALQRAALGTGLTKFFDVNLTKLLTDRPDRDTLEVRILPGALHGADIVARAALVEALLRRCRRPEVLPAPTTASPAAAQAELLALAAT
ncbi:putative amidoligase enzyme [Kineococcus xinjiangensis]|uniref:Putative amidoligase enzyme n=1 Tax=Kineococcus xinjiangensis TaxID=512762 RepID=A0A2S6IWR2_9ACTN|nr:amidoligase family protein [Kineococcus xinjiangensis]PPK98788.1 putative amidoligase enzyme [Kineococcus xinjiangensis]